MTSAILELRDGVAFGPLHTPTPTHSNLRFEDVEPLTWLALCGVSGNVYQRGGLARLGHTTECFDCLVLKHGGGTQKQKSAARREAMKYESTVRKCEDCGRATSAKSYKLCRPCYLARPGAPCGTRSRYVLGCRCSLCRRAEADYAREYKRKRARLKAAA